MSESKNKVEFKADISDALNGVQRKILRATRRSNKKSPMISKATKSVPWAV